MKISSYSRVCEGVISRERQKSKPRKLFTILAYPIFRKLISTPCKGMEYLDAEKRRWIMVLISHHLLTQSPNPSIPPHPSLKALERHRGGYCPRSILREVRTLFRARQSYFLCFRAGGHVNRQARFLIPPSVTLECEGPVRRET